MEIRNERRVIPKNVKTDFFGVPIIMVGTGAILAGPLYLLTPLRKEGQQH